MNRTRVESKEDGLQVLPKQEVVGALPQKERDLVLIDGA